MFDGKLVITSKCFGSLSTSVVNKATESFGWNSKVRKKQRRGQFAGTAVCYNAAHSNIPIQNKWPEQREAQRWATLSVPSKKKGGRWRGGEIWCDIFLDVGAVGNAKNK